MACDPTGRLCLGEARSHLAAAGDALDGWYARQTTEGYTYGADGRAARAGHRAASATPDARPLRTVHAVPVIVPNPSSAARCCADHPEVNP